MRLYYGWFQTKASYKGKICFFKWNVVSRSTSGDLTICAIPGDEFTKEVYGTDERLFKKEDL